MKTKIPKDIQAEVEKELSKLLGFVDSKFIFTYDKKTGAVFIGKERIDDARLVNLKSEAEFLLNSDLWKILSETIKFMAYEQIFVKSQSFDDVRSGKMWLYHLDIQKKMLDMFKAYKKIMPPMPPTPNPQKIG